MEWSASSVDERLDVESGCAGLQTVLSCSYVFRDFCGGHPKLFLVLVGLRVQDIEDVDVTFGDVFHKSRLWIDQRDLFLNVKLNLFGDKVRLVENYNIGKLHLRNKRIYKV